MGGCRPMGYYNFMFEKIISKFYGIKTGLKPLPKDDRDLGFRWLFGEYTPKYQQINLVPFGWKTQKFNNCNWVASTGAKEIDEGLELSERSLVIMGKEAGYVSGDGFSNLRDAEKILQKNGIAEMKYLPEENVNWAEYSDSKKLTAEARKNAEEHKTKSYWAINSVKEVYKAIDDGRPVKIGVRWYAGLNMGGGFAYPWIWRVAGYFVGGHAMYARGYNLNYKGQKVCCVRNSYGKEYGDDGDLYFTEADLQKQISKYGAYVNLDMDVDLGRWLITHQGTVVKTENKTDVYLIQGNQKRKYADWLTLLAHGKNRKDIITVPNEYLDKVEQGKNILFFEGGNVKQVKEMAQMIAEEDKELLPLLKNYFNELF